MNEPDEINNSAEGAQERIWEDGWEGHELAQLQRMAKLSFADKVRWLESAQQLSLQLKAQREKLAKHPTV